MVIMTKMNYFAKGRRGPGRAAALIFLRFGIIRILGSIIAYALWHGHNMINIKDFIEILILLKCFLAVAHCPVERRKDDR
jgi:hypothetical protein